MKKYSIDITGYITSFNEKQCIIEAENLEQACKKAEIYFDKDNKRYIDGYIESYDLKIENIEEVEDE